MKKHLSVFMLMARSTIYKVLGLFVLMAAVEGALFWLALSRGPTDSGFSLERVVQNSRMVWVFGICFLLLTALLSRACRQVSGSYTALRLSISGGWVAFWQSVYNVFCYLLFWAVQILIAIVLCRVYAAKAPAEYITGQTVFLAFYRSKFLHSLLPFEDAVFWVRNAVFALTLGICAARRPGRADRGIWGQIVLTAVVVGFFLRGIGNAAAGLFAVLVVAAFTVYYIFFYEWEGEPVHEN